MISPAHSFGNSPLVDRDPLQVLVRALRYGQGSFVPLVAHCNDRRLRRNTLAQLRSQLPFEICEVVLAPGDRTLYAALRQRLDGRAPQAISVDGLERVRDLDTLLPATDMVRGEFPKHFACPLVLWTDDRTLRTLVERSPHFKSIAPPTIRFTPPPRSLANRVAALPTDRCGDRSLA